LDSENKSEFIKTLQSKIAEQCNELEKTKSAIVTLEIDLTEKDEKIKSIIQQTTLRKIKI